MLMLLGKVEQDADFENDVAVGSGGFLAIIRCLPLFAPFLFAGVLLCLLIFVFCF